MRAVFSSRTIVISNSHSQVFPSNMNPPKTRISTSLVASVNNNMISLVSCMWFGMFPNGCLVGTMSILDLAKIVFNTVATFKGDRKVATQVKIWRVLSLFLRFSLFLALSLSLSLSVVCVFSLLCRHPLHMAQ